MRRGTWPTGSMPLVTWSAQPRRRKAWGRCLRWPPGQRCRPRDEARRVAAICYKGSGLAGSGGRDGWGNKPGHEKHLSSVLTSYKGGLRWTGCYRDKGEKSSQAKGKKKAKVKYDRKGTIYSPRWELLPSYTNTVITCLGFIRPWRDGVISFTHIFLWWGLCCKISSSLNGAWWSPLSSAVALWRSGALVHIQIHGQIKDPLRLRKHAVQLCLSFSFTLSLEVFDSPYFPAETQSIPTLYGPAFLFYEPVAFLLIHLKSWAPDYLHLNFNARC